MQSPYADAVSDPNRFERAIAAIDAANAHDPNTIRHEGRDRPKELVHAELATDWVKRLRPEASEALLLAARGHHLRRWKSPRSNYPEGRAGYLRWRRDLHDQHAHELGEILRAAGYDTETAEHVARIVRKRDLRNDEEVQAFEDALCLVFLQTQLASIAQRLEEQKMISVLAKTAAKMTSSGLAAAESLDLAPEPRRLLTAALRQAELSRADADDHD